LVVFEDVKVVVVDDVEVVVIDDVAVVAVVEKINVTVEVSSDEMSKKVESGTSVLVKSLDGSVFR
jgi:hypothetical protein